ncbi:MAG: Fic family protein [Bacteroidia bacterium]|nr:Fic family protein [Bacteroidia bacterium]
MSKYIYQQTGWPAFRWDNDVLLLVLGRVRNLQGRLTGKMEALGFGLSDEANLTTLTLDVVKSAEIEGEKLDTSQVRSSVARHLGMDIAGLVPSDRNVDGVVEMTLDAIRKYKEPLTKRRLFSWHSSLFPTGRSGMLKIITGKWRDDSTGPMQVVSGPMGREKVHFQAPPAKEVENEMSQFLKWFNSRSDTDPVLKAGVAHFWFITIHPFEDGNGRIARGLADMLLAQAERSDRRFYSMSAQIRSDRKRYYEVLEETQKGTLDLTGWLLWFMECLESALNKAEDILSAVFFKAAFWNKYSSVHLNERQRLMLNKILDGFTGKLTSSKWAKISGCSADTALRDIEDLIEKGILKKEQAGGRSTSYKLNFEAKPKSRES